MLLFEFNCAFVDEMCYVEVCFGLVVAFGVVAMGFGLFDV